MIIYYSYIIRLYLFIMNSLERPLITRPSDVRLDLSESESVVLLPAYLKQKQNRWWKTLVLLFCCISILCAFAVLIWRIGIV